MLDPISQSAALRSKGLASQSSALALDFARDNAASIDDVRKAFLLVYSNSSFDLFPEILEIAAAHIEAYSNEATMMEAFGYVSWVANQYGLAESCLQRLLSIDSQNSNAYRYLVMLYLTMQRWDDASTVFKEGQLRIRKSNFLREFTALIETVSRGEDQVEFDIDGMSYVFGLSCFNGQAMEADIHHANRQLVEYPELRYLKEWLPTGGNIVECGCLVGNHTVFFLKNLLPRSITVFDADQRSIEQMTRNVSLNATDEMDTVLNCHHRAIAKETGNRIHLLGTDVETVSLSDAISEDTTFAKVDIDGMELESLDGVVEGLERSRARLMIEVQNETIETYKKRLADIGYELAHAIGRDTDSNLFFSPIER